MIITIHNKMYSTLLLHPFLVAIQVDSKERKKYFGLKSDRYVIFTYDVHVWCSHVVFTCGVHM